MRQFIDPKNVQIETGQVEIGDETIVWNSFGRMADFCVLFLHGAGKANSERMRYLALYLASCGMRCVQFDHSGHGSSSGKLSASSLSKRLAEAEAFVDMFKPDAIVGSSMGGHTALQILSRYPLRNLVLFAPAIFRDDADHVEFGREWSRLIREEESFIGSRVPADARVESMNLLHIIGSEDQVIPKGVTEIYSSLSKRCKSAAFLQLTGGPHNLHDWLRERHSIRGSVCGAVNSFIIR